MCWSLILPKKHVFDVLCFYVFIIFWSSIMNNSFFRKFLTLAFLALFVAVFSLSAQDKQPMNIVETALAAGNFKTLATALTEADLVETLKGDGPFTVFAPTDAAFAKIPANKLQALLKDKEALKKVLLYHVVSGKVMAKDVLTMNGKKAKTVEGSEAAIKVKGKSVMVDAAKVEKTDIECSNGVIHVIDSVIMPAAKK
jgi:uncharacterized surface protein with fasciclin (FAS1) repeats